MGLKAYVVNDDFEGHSVIEFAERAVVARRNGAAELSADFGDVSCRRAPWADEFAPGPVPPKECIERGGWWYECTCGCGRRIDNQGGTHDYDLDGDDGELNPMAPVYVGQSVYWNQACLDNDERERREREEQAERDQAEAEAAVLAKFPFATDIKALRGYCKNRLLQADFRFPGGLSRATWTIGDSVVSVAVRDVETWKALVPEPAT